VRALLDTSVIIGAEDPGDLEGAISAASLAELHFGVLVVADEDERARSRLWAPEMIPSVENTRSVHNRPV